MSGNSEPTFVQEEAGKAIESIQFAMEKYSSIPEWQSLFLDVVIKELQKQRQELWPANKGRRHFEMNALAMRK